MRKRQRTVSIEDVERPWKQQRVGASPWCSTVGCFNKIPCNRHPAKAMASDRKPEIKQPAPASNTEQSQSSAGPMSHSDDDGPPNMDNDGVPENPAVVQPGVVFLTAARPESLLLSFPDSVFSSLKEAPDPAVYSVHCWVSNCERLLWLRDKNDRYVRRRSALHVTSCSVRCGHVSGWKGANSKGTLSVLPGASL
jgi:hypothetical protein